MEHSTKESGIFILIRGMVEDTRFGLMEVFMKDIGRSIKLMEEAA